MTTDARSPWIPLVRGWIPVAAWLLAGLVSAPAGAKELVVRPDLATDGVYQLSWVADGEVRLEEARDPGFADARTVYTGSDGATVLTGRSDGVYHYRLFAGETLRAGPARAEVVHHSLGRALAFFAVGGFVFLATSLLVVRGNREDPDHG